MRQLVSMIPPTSFLVTRNSVGVMGTPWGSCGAVSRGTNLAVCMTGFVIRRGKKDRHIVALTGPVSGVPFWHMLIMQSTVRNAKKETLTGRVSLSIRRLFLKLNVSIRLPISLMKNLRHPNMLSSVRPFMTVATSIVPCFGLCVTPSTMAVVVRPLMTDVISRNI